MKYIKILLTGLLLFAFFFGNSEESNNLYTANAELINHANQQDFKTQKTTNETYEVRMGPVIHHKAQITDLLVHFLGNDHIDKALNLVKNGGSVMLNLNHEKATRMAVELRKLGVKVEIIDMKTNVSDQDFKASSEKSKREIAKKSDMPMEQIKTSQPKVMSPKQPSNSEYALLCMKIKDQLNVKTDAEAIKILRSLKEEKNNRGMIQLAKKTGWDLLHVNLMAMAIDRSDETGLPPELYYAIYHEALPTDENALFITDDDSLIMVWEKAIKGNIIDASFGDQLNNYLEKFTQEKQIPLPARPLHP